jgi:DNA (cytosine-5)-methyltransferase 1
MTLKKLETNKSNQGDKKVIPLKNQIIKFISLFAGCGGSSLGYVLAGLKELLAIEWDKNAREVFKLNFSQTPVYNEDISKLTGKKLLQMMGLKRGELDLFDASPPCQSFSSSNTKRDVYDKRNDLYLKTIKLIMEIQPKVFVIENVEGMRKGKMKKVWNSFVREFKKMNYRIEFKVLKAEQYGVPQERRRVIVIGVRNDINQLINLPSLFPTPSTKASDMSVKAHFPHIVGFSAGQFKDRIISSDRPSCTITKTSSMWVYEFDGFRRKPTIEELKVLSSFPSDFKLIGSYNQQFARIGNAVPPMITKAIGLHIKQNILTPNVMNALNEKNPISKAA